MIALEQKKAKAIKQRTSISAEVYGFFNQKKVFVPPFIPKSNEQIAKIKETVIHSFLFNNLEDKELNTVIGAMKEKKIQ